MLINYTYVYNMRQFIWIMNARGTCVTLVFRHVYVYVCMYVCIIIYINYIYTIIALLASY